MLQAVAFKRQLSTERSTFLELGNRRHGFAVAGLALRLEIEDGSCTMARIATMGGGAVAQRISSAESVLEGAAIDETVIVAAVAALRAALDPPHDVHADADYRRHALGVMLDRALRSEETLW